MRTRWVLVLSATSVALCLAATGCGASADPFRIGIVTACENADYFSTLNSSWIAGAELPLLDRGGTPAGPASKDRVHGASVAGRPVQLEIGCSEPFNPESTLAALRLLVESQHVDAVVGPSSEDDPIVARYARKHPGVVFMLGDYSQSTTLRSAAPNMFRFELDGAQESAGIAAYAYHRLGWRHAAILGERDPTGWGSVAGFDAEFCSLGGRIQQRLWAPGTATDTTRWAQRVSPNADGVFLASALYNASGFVKSWARHHHGLAKRLVVGWNPINGANPRLRGVVTVSPTPWKATPAWTRYTSSFAKWFPKIKDQTDGLTYYDEIEPVLEALQSAHGDTSIREGALKAALTHLHYDSPEGPIHLDARNQAIGPAYLGRIVGDDTASQFATVRNVDESFGGYFKPNSAAPGPHSPACVKRKPPPWAVRPTR